VMEKHPWHFTSMKKLFGPCTKRLSLCLEASRAAGGLSKSISCASCFVRIIIKEVRERMGQYTDLGLPNATISIASPSILEKATRTHKPSARMRRGRNFPTHKERKFPSFWVSLALSSPSRRRRAFLQRRTKNKCRPLKPRRDVTERPGKG
jgi:hypothetical protein